VGDVLVRSRAQEDEAGPTPRVSGRHGVDLRDHVALLRAGPIEVTTDEHEVVAIGERQVAGPRLDESREALDTMETADGEDQRQVEAARVETCDCRAEVVCDRRGFGRRS
jgi:hypothetical protein